MTKISLIAAAALLATSISTAALASSEAMSALTSANTVSITNLSGSSDNPLLSSNGAMIERVDLDSLHARIQQNESVRRQVEAFGASIDDVVGISGSSTSDIILYVRG